MLAFPSMLVNAAEKVGIPVPPNPDKYDREAFPRWHIYCALQLNRPIRWGEHWSNAEIIAKFPEDKLRTATLDDFLAAGLEWQS